MKHLLTITILFCLSIHFRVEAQTVPVTLKVIDKMKGNFTPNDTKIFSWVAQWNPSYLEYKNSGNWYSNFFDGYAGGKLTKTDTDWTWSYTFDAAKGGSFSWNPSTGVPDGSATEITTFYGLRNKGNNVDFFVSSSGNITGETTIIYTDKYIALADDKGTITNQYTFVEEETVDTSGNDFLHAFGRKIVDKDGKEVLLRGVGLGNYMLVEPYMWGINNAKEKKSDTQQAILASLAKLTGWDNVNTFMDEYRKNYMGEADVAFLKESGFNSIRLPMHYNLFIDTVAANNELKEKGFAMVDELLGWCEKHEIYLILDMHAVPGGQSTDKAISDQYSPGLWDGNANGTAAQYQTKLITLWKEIARRYADKQWIGGYDLINEIMYYPPAGRNLAPEIRSLYERITSAIREVDKKHILFIEGNGYANDHTGLTPPWDDNLVYSFHRYWCGNSQADIQYVLNLRDLYKVPVWMGESGENSNTWFTNAIELLENNKVGWAWWSYKKVSNISGIVSVPRPEGWNKLLSYLESSTDNHVSLGLDTVTTKSILMQLAENTKLEKAKTNKDVIYSMIDQLRNNETIPFETNNLPGKLFATEYDLGRNGFAYNEKGILSRESMESGAYNQGWVGRNDAVDIESCGDAASNGFNIGWTEQGEWLNYTVNIQQPGKYKVKMGYAVPGTGNVTLKLDGIAVLNAIGLPNTGSWSNYKAAELGEIDLPEGIHTIQVYINAGFNFIYLNFDKAEVTGIASIGYPSSFDCLICPNPVEDTASFIYTLPDDMDKVTFRIYNMQGKLVDMFRSHSTVQGENKIDYTCHLVAGIYQNEMNVEKQGKSVYRKSIKMIVN